MSSFDDQHFTNIVARKKEFDGGEIAEQIFNVAIVENPLQSKLAVRDGMALSFPLVAPEVQVSHLQGVGS